MKKENEYAKDQILSEGNKSINFSVINNDGNIETLLIGREVYDMFNENVGRDIPTKNFFMNWLNSIKL